MLYQQDNILYEPIKNGTGSKKHRFYYGYCPFEDNAVDNTQITVDDIDTIESIDNR